MRLRGYPRWALADRLERMARNESASVEKSADKRQNPVWFKPIMVGLMIVGLAWIVVYYVSNQQFPIPSLGAWNILVGFGIAFLGFLMTTRWR